MINPCGYQILIKPYSGAEKIGNVYLASETQDKNKVAAVVCQVVKLGPDAYQDKDRFPNGNWCSEGDWVVIGKLAGSRLLYEGDEYRLLTDDQVLATVDDPNQITRPF